MISRCNGFLEVKSHRYFPGLKCVNDINVFQIVQTINCQPTILYNHDESRPGLYKQLANCLYTIYANLTASIISLLSVYLWRLQICFNVWHYVLVYTSKLDVLKHFNFAQRKTVFRHGDVEIASEFYARDAGVGGVACWRRPRVVEADAGAVAWGRWRRDGGDVCQTNNEIFQSVGWDKY